MMMCSSKAQTVNISTLIYEPVVMCVCHMQYIKIPKEDT